MLRISTKDGWTSTVQPWSRSHRKTRNIRSSPRWSREKRGAGVPPILALRLSGQSSTSRNDSHGLRSCSKNLRQSVPKSSSCDGLRMADARFKKLCASSGISVPLRPYARSRNIKLHSQLSPFLNWSLCLTSVEDRLAPRSRVCACLDSPRPCYLRAKLKRTGLTRWSLRVAVVPIVIFLVVVFLFVLFFFWLFPKRRTSAGTEL